MFIVDEKTEMVRKQAGIGSRSAGAPQQEDTEEFGMFYFTILLSAIAFPLGSRPGLCPYGSFTLWTETLDL
jgi:hypothetical protein